MMILGDTINSPQLTHQNIPLQAYPHISTPAAAARSLTTPTTPAHSVQVPAAVSSQNTTTNAYAQVLPMFNAQSNFASSVTTPSTPTNSVQAAVSSQNTTANAYAPLPNSQSTFPAGFAAPPTPVLNRSSPSFTTAAIHDTAIRPAAATQQNAFGGIPAAVQHAQPNVHEWTGYIN
jgi:hypothetical protein